MARRYPIAGIAAHVVAEPAGAAAVVALAVVAGSAAWLVAADPSRRSAPFLDSLRPPGEGFPSPSCDMFARYARAIPA